MTEPVAVSFVTLGALLLLGIVAVDDAWGLLVFSFLLAAAQARGGMPG